MKRFHNFPIWLCLVLGISAAPTGMHAQNEEEAHVSHWKIDGYLKNMQTFVLAQDINTLLSSGFLHQRLNIQWTPDAHWTFVVQDRNRLFYGEQVKWTPGFGKSISADNGLLKLSWLPVNEKTLVLHAALDRCWVGWNQGPWDIRAGRQRINWGISTTWNPNDIFNTYNFLDFDYEERPGSDAIRIRFNTSAYSQLEAAASWSELGKEQVAALRYGFNKWNYDFQVLGGLFHNDWMAGAGWAGNISNAGFKGECAFFYPRQGNGSPKAALALVLNADYQFSAGWYLNGSFLYNSSGSKSIIRLDQLQQVTLSPKNLMPSRFTCLLQTAKSITPLLNGSLAFVYSPESNLLIAIPGLTYSVANNWDLDLTGQLFWAETDKGTINALGKAVYLRLKWSF